MNKIIGYKTILDTCPQQLDERVNRAMSLTGYVPWGAPYSVCKQIENSVGPGLVGELSVCVNEYCQAMVKYE